jgi:TonB family protein
MKLLAFAAVGVLCAASLIAAPPARANVFCPATVDAVENLGQLGRGNTYGVLLNFDPGDTASVRLRVDSATTRYAVDFNDIPPIGSGSVRMRRYFVMPNGERVVAAWVESTGTGPDARTECPITNPYQADAPPPSEPRLAREIAEARRQLRDTFSTRTVTATPQSFGRTEARTCTQAYAPPRAILAVPADVPPEARAVKATGTVIVRVDLDETSTVLDGSVARSSGFAPLDRAALAAALKSSYRTETFACRSIASSYQFAVTFSAASYANPGPVPSPAPT